MTVDAIIYMCIYVCGCIVVFDVVFAVSVWFNERTLPKRTVYLKELLENQMVTKRHVDERSDKLVGMLQSRMRDINWLLAYLHAFQRIQQAHQNDIVSIRPLQKFNIKLFEKLSQVYAQRNDENKAFFAYIVYQVIPSGEEINSDYRAFNSLVRHLAVFMDSRSVYVWCNTFRAIVKMGSVEYVYYALTLLNGHIHLRNSKFFSDYLIEFKGDMQRLNAQILDSLFEFNPEIQVMIINYLRLLPPSVSQQSCLPVIFKVLCDPDMNGETVIAAIRYFGKHPYDKAYEKLLEFLQMDVAQINEYNFAAVAAITLSSYPSQRTVDALLRQLSSPDWYVRFNSADSLLSLNVDDESVLLNSKDRFAKDILIHRSEINRMRKGAYLAK